MSNCFGFHLLRLNIVDAICREQMLWTPTIVGKYDVLHLSRLNAVDALHIMSKCYWLRLSLVNGVD